MPRRIRDYSSNNLYALIVIFDIISRIIFLWAFLVLMYWLLTPFFIEFKIVMPNFISYICEKPYELASMVGYRYHDGINFAGGIAALILFIIGYIFELICNMLIRR